MKKIYQISKNGLSSPCIVTNEYSHGTNLIIHMWHVDPNKLYCPKINRKAIHGKVIKKGIGLAISLKRLEISEYKEIKEGEFVICQIKKQ